MIRSTLLLLTVLNVSFLSRGQVPKKRLPQNINVPTYSHIFPSLSGDGMQMLYLTDYTNSEGFEMKYSQKIGPETWADPEPVPQINRVGLDHIGSFCLSYDGNFVVFSSRRSPGVGMYDIWVSEKTGNSWSAPQNPGKPLNSAGNEGNPCLSPDGKSIYFMRCETMDNLSKSNCSLYVSHRISDRKWSEPELLPPTVNTGHETTPRILADNETLVFASGRSGGKGKLDLYVSRFEHKVWSDPVPLTFINTPENDEYISVPARGDLMYFTGSYRDNLNIFKAVIPEEYRPEKVLMLAGKVTCPDDRNPSEDILIQAFDVRTGQAITSTKLRKEDNGFTLFLPEGKIYDVSAFPLKGGFSYYGEIIDLENMSSSRREDRIAELLPVQPGMIIPLSTIRFVKESSEISRESETEIKRIIGFLKKNPGVKLEIGAYLAEVKTDTVSSRECTVAKADTVFITIPTEVSSETDGVSFTDGNSEVVTTDGSEDKLDSLLLVLNESVPGEILSPEDSLLNLGYLLSDSDDESNTYFKVNFTYHNDISEELANALAEKLVRSGVPENLLEVKSYADHWTIDRSDDERDYWIELKVLEN